MYICNVIYQWFSCNVNLPSRSQTLWLKCLSQFNYIPHRRACLIRFAWLNGFLFFWSLKWQISVNRFLKAPRFLHAGFYCISNIVHVSGCLVRSVKTQARERFQTVEKTRKHNWAHRGSYKFTDENFTSYKVKPYFKDISQCEHPNRDTWKEIVQLSNHNDFWKQKILSNGPIKFKI